jgi:F-type H+-transporting ATPase subunit b
MADLSILAAAAEEHEATAWGLSAGGWWGMTVITLIALMIYLKVPQLVGAMLDKKIAGIREMLDEAAQLRKEAEALKAEYEKKIKSADKHAAKMKAAAEEDAEAIVKKAKADATALIARREKMAEDKIAAAERAAVDELRARASDAAAAAARKLIAEQNDAEADSKLVDKAISGI